MCQPAPPRERWPTPSRAIMRPPALTCGGLVEQQRCAAFGATPLANFCHRHLKEAGREPRTSATRKKAGAAEPTCAGEEDAATDWCLFSSRFFSRSARIRAQVACMWAQQASTLSKSNFGVGNGYACPWLRRPWG
uniref:Uncharacterized protein n=1 Tax=Arundo donax TaxID=35708 RepID=A0A0A9HNL8_ARUDO